MKKLIPFVCIIILLLIPLTALSKHISATFISLYDHPKHYIELRTDGTFKYYEGSIGGSTYGEYEIKGKIIRFKTELGWTENEWHDSYIYDSDEKTKWIRKPEPIKGKFITEEADFKNAKVGEFWWLLKDRLCLERRTWGEWETFKVVNKIVNNQTEYTVVVYILDVGRHEITKGYVYCLVWLMDRRWWKDTSKERKHFHWENSKLQEFRGWIDIDYIHNARKILISPVKPEGEKRVRKEASASVRKEASAIIKKAFELTKKDRLAILSISMESENVALVKFKLNGFEISSKIIKYVDKGWQIDEVYDDYEEMWVPAEKAINILNITKAVDIVKKYFELTKKDSLEILGISIESTDVATVKFKINDVQILSQMERHSNGWELESYRNELGEWEWIENIKFFNEPSRQKHTMKRITLISTAIADYVTDNGVVPEQDGIYEATSSFYNSLSPFYVKILPLKDAWGNDFRVYCGTACNGKYGITGADSNNFLVVSLGADGEKELWEFDLSDREAGLIEMRTEDDFDIDLVMWNGSWIRGIRTAHVKKD